MFINTRTGKKHKINNFDISFPFNSESIYNTCDLVLKRLYSIKFNISEENNTINISKLEGSSAMSILKHDKMINETEHITEKGIAHLTKGGYTAQYKKERREKILKRVTIWATIFVPTISLLLTNWDKLFFLYLYIKIFCDK